MIFFKRGRGACGFFVTEWREVGGKIILKMYIFMDDSLLFKI